MFDVYLRYYLLLGSSVKTLIFRISLCKRMKNIKFSSYLTARMFIRTVFENVLDRGNEYGNNVERRNAGELQ